MTSDFDGLIAAAMEAPISGWRFPFLEERLVREAPSWDYVVAARTLLDGATTAIDHGTGGGEILSDIGVAPRLLIATGAHPPNVGVAAARLRPLKAWVVQVSGQTHDSRGPGVDGTSAARRLPFRDSWLDVFLCRNGAFCANEVFRLLRTGGHLLHQSGRWGPPRPGEISLRDYFLPVRTWQGEPWPVRDALLDAGFLVQDYREELTRNLYVDIAAVVFTLRMVPWTVGDFRLEEHRDRLLELHRQIDRDGHLVTASTAVYVHATKA